MSRIAALLVASLLPALAASAQEARWWREVQVAEPGPVVVELDGLAADRAAIDLQVIAPDGRAIDAELRSERGGAWPVRVERVVATAAGWQVELDAGAAPPRHAGLRFALANPAVAESVALEGGDGGSWSELARGDLFRLGSESNLQDFVLTYEPTEVRRLRLSWPRAAGLPELSDAAVLPAAERGGEKRRVPTQCLGIPADGPGALDCLAEVPAGCRYFDLELPPREAPLAFYLWRAENGRWHSIGAGERRRHGLLRFEVPGGATYGFQLESPEAPKQVAATCEANRRRLHFIADRAGVYQLTYGRLTAPERPVGCTGCEEERPPGQLLPLGREQGGKPLAWPKAAEPGPRLEGKFGRSWKVGSKAGAGELVALDLPEELVTGPGRAQEGLRLDAQGRQVPFIAEIAPLPRQLYPNQERKPESVGGGRSRFAISFAGRGGEADLRLFARGPFERRVRFLQPDPVPGRHGEVEIAPAVRWVCPATLVLRCELRATLSLLPPPATGNRENEKTEVVVELEDGDNPPLAAVDAEIGTAWPVLYFVHPGSPVILREGKNLAAPRYDFASLGPLLDRGEAVKADAEPGADDPQLDGPRWLLPLAVGLAALVLLAVLARMIRQDRT